MVELIGTLEYGATYDRNAGNVDSDFSGNLKKVYGYIEKQHERTRSIRFVVKASDYKMNDELALQFGADWRTATIGHYRSIRDLIGGDYFVDEYRGSNNNEFNTTTQSQMLRLGDKVLYHNTNTVDWIGGFASAKYNTEQMTAFGVFGWTSSSFTVTDHFTKYNRIGPSSSWKSSGDGGAL